MLPLESLFRELNDRGGRYLVVGGLALALGADERLAWLEAMMAIAVESGALPKRLPDQLAGARGTAT